MDKAKIQAYRRPGPKEPAKKKVPDGEVEAAAGPVGWSPGWVANHLHKWIDGGLGLTGATDGLGFLFYYELLTGTLPCQLSPEESPSQLASVLLRLLGEGDTKPGCMMSILRVMDSSPGLAASAPRFVEESGGGVSLAAMGQMMGQKKARNSFLDAVLSHIQQNAGQVEVLATYPGGEDEWHLVSQVRMLRNLPQLLITGTFLRDCGCVLRMRTMPASSSHHLCSQYRLWASSRPRIGLRYARVFQTLRVTTISCATSGA